MERSVVVIHQQMPIRPNGNGASRGDGETFCIGDQIPDFDAAPTIAAAADELATIGGKGKPLRCFFVPAQAANQFARLPIPEINRGLNAAPRGCTATGNFLPIRTDGNLAVGTSLQRL